MDWPDTSPLKRTLSRTVAMAEASGQIVGAHHFCRAVLMEPAIIELLALADPASTCDSVACSADDPSLTDVHVSPGFRRILDLTLQESRELGDTHVGPEHAILALVAAGNEALLGPVWFPFVGCVAPDAEREALVNLVRAAPDASILRSQLAKHPRRTLLRAVGGIDDRLLRPLTGYGDAKDLLHVAENDKTSDKHPDSAAQAREEISE